jgi:transcriptional regulator of PTS gene
MRKETGINSVKSKFYNRGLILRLVATGEASSRIELSNMTHLAKMTVSNIVSEFIESGVLEEDEDRIEVAGSGRNPIRLRIAAGAPAVIGLLIRRTFMEAVLCTPDLRILERCRTEYDDLDKETLLRDAYDLIDRMIDAAGHTIDAAGREITSAGRKVCGIGVAVMGPMDINQGIILNPPNFHGIENVPIGSLLKEKFSLPVIVDHDENSAAQAEALYGGGKEEHDFIFFGVSEEGIGSGFVSDGKVYHSRIGMASELGHISIDRNGPLCPCGNRGCVELYANTGAVLSRLRKETGKNLMFRQFCGMSYQWDVDKIMKEMVRDISVALTSGVNILQPELVVLGDDCIDWDEKYVRMLEAMVNETRFARETGHVRIRKSHFGKDAQLIGSAANVLHQIFEGNLPLT